MKTRRRRFCCYCKSIGTESVFILRHFIRFSDGAHGTNIAALPTVHAAFQKDLRRYAAEVDTALWTYVSAAAATDAFVGSDTIHSRLRIFVITGGGLPNKQMFQKVKG